MDLEQLQDLAEKKLKINDTELDLESLKTPQLHNKYLKHLNKFKLLLTKSQADLNTLRRDKWEYYTGKADAAVYLLKPFDIKVLKSDVHIYMDSDSDLQRADQKVAYLNQVVKYLEQVLRSINNRTFLIKNAIEWKKFTSGAI